MDTSLQQTIQSVNLHKHFSHADIGAQGFGILNRQRRSYDLTTAPEQPVCRAESTKQRDNRYLRKSASEHGFSPSVYEPVDNFSVLQRGEILPGQMQ